MALPYFTGPNVFFGIWTAAIESNGFTVVEIDRTKHPLQHKFILEEVCYKTTFEAAEVRLVERRFKQSAQCNDTNIQSQLFQMPAQPRSFENCLLHQNIFCVLAATGISKCHGYGSRLNLFRSMEPKSAIIRQLDERSHELGGCFCLCDKRSQGAIVCGRLRYLSYNNHIYIGKSIDMNSTSESSFVACTKGSLGLTALRLIFSRTNCRGPQELVPSLQTIGA